MLALNKWYLCLILEVTAAVVLVACQPAHTLLSPISALLATLHSGSPCSIGDAGANIEVLKPSKILGRMPPQFSKSHVWFLLSESLSETSQGNHM